eukprot:5923395-Pyramimonas_sp.AAC.1
MSLPTVSPRCAQLRRATSSNARGKNGQGPSAPAESDAGKRLPEADRETKDAYSNMNKHGLEAASVQINVRPMQSMPQCTETSSDVQIDIRICFYSARSFKIPEQQGRDKKRNISRLR